MQQPKSADPTDRQKGDGATPKWFRIIGFVALVVMFLECIWESAL